MQDNLASEGGKYVAAYKGVLRGEGILVTAYFGHSYIGKHCKKLCILKVALQITSPLLLRFESDLKKIAALRRRRNRLRHAIKKAPYGMYHIEYQARSQKLATVEQQYERLKEDLQRNDTYQEAMSTRQKWI